MGAFRAPGDEDKIRHRVLAVVLHIQEASWRFHGGIAFMTNMLLTKQQIHQARLTEHFTVFDGLEAYQHGVGIGPARQASPICLNWSAAKSRVSYSSTARFSSRQRRWRSKTSIFCSPL